MIVRVHGVKRTRSKGRLYYYHRKTKTRIIAAPDTAAFIAEVERLDELPRPVPKKGAGTFGALVAAYRGSPEYARLAERTRADYEKVFDFLAPFDLLPFVQLDEPAILGIRDDAFAEKKRRFANHVLQVLGTVLNWGKPRKLSSGYPLAGLRGIKIPRERDRAPANRPWTGPECETVLGAATGGLKLAIALGLYAAMRIGDAARVTWSIYNGSHLEWRQGKTGDPVRMPADRALKAILDHAPRQAATIVTGAAGLPLKQSSLAKFFRTLIVDLQSREEVGPGLTFHGLRHTNGKQLADLGADPRMIQALLGHRSMAASLHYSNAADRDRAASAAVHVLERGRNTNLANSRARFGKPPARRR